MTVLADLLGTVGLICWAVPLALLGALGAVFIAAAIRDLFCDRPRRW